MKILQLGKFYPIRGGVEKVMWDLTRGLSARGLDCDMLCAELDRDEVIQMNAHGRVICVKAWRKQAGTMIAPAMVSWLRKHQKDYDIVHIHHPDPMAAIALKLSGFKGRVILHWHSDIVKQKTLLRFYAPIQRWLINRADTIIGTTKVYLQESPFLQDVQEKTIAIPIGIEPITYEPSLVQSWKNRFSGKRIILSIGRLVPYKGLDYLIAASSLLGPEYQVLIVGEGPSRDELEEQIRRKGVAGKVKLLGYLEDDDAHALLSACNVFVLSSIQKSEAFGIVQIEAMSLGKPVVATEVPESGVSWVNAPGVSGLNVPVKNPEALAAAIQEICGDETLYQSLSEGARKRFYEQFTLKMMIDTVISIYSKEEHER